MERFRLFLIMGIALLVGGQSLFAQNKSKKEETRENVKQIVESGEFTIDVKRAIPSGGKSITLTSPYSLQVRNDSVISYLPYYGRAYSIPYGGGNALRFSESLTDYSLSFDKKGTAKIIFKSRTPEDTYTINVQIFDNGSSNIQVTSINRQSITFYGDLELEKKE